MSESTTATAVRPRLTLKATPKMLAAAGLAPAPAPAPAPEVPSPDPKPPAARPDKPAAKGKAQTARGKRAHARNLRVGALLAERFPAAFTSKRPLAIGIFAEIRAVVPESELPRDDLGGFLASWTKRPAYLAALERGDRRVHLDGSDAGPAFDEAR